MDIKAIYEAAYALAQTAQEIQPKRPTPTKKLKHPPKQAKHPKVFHNREYRTSGKVNTCSKARIINHGVLDHPRACRTIPDCRQAVLGNGRTIGTTFISRPAASQP